LKTRGWLALGILWCCTNHGCGRVDPTPALDIAIIGGPGSSPGHFATPRAAAWDPRGALYVVDKTARIQKFDGDGRYVLGWSTPASEKGRPTGLAVDREGRLVVADTHYHRILRYSPQGELVDSFGSEGTAPGQFIYPTGVAVAEDGAIYVSEFGGNDRIQVFSPDGGYLRHWGRYGEAAGEFKRPQGIALAPDRVYVADAANHRIQVLTRDGTPIAAWPDVQYPYSVALDADGNVLVAEYGRHRVVKFSPEGQRLGQHGHAGVAPGELDTPWAAIPAGSRIYVVDSENHRVQNWPKTILDSPRADP